MDLRFYLLVFLRRLPWFLILLVAGAAVGAVLARVLPPTYVSQALLVVESEQTTSDLLPTTVQTQAGEQLQIIQQRILARDSLIEMANRLHIYSDASNRDRMSADEIVQDLRERIVIAVSGSSTQRGNSQVTLVNVSFKADNGQLAANVANEVVTQILNENVSMRTTVARQTLDFFRQEVTRLDQDLTRISGKILSFKEANRDTLPDSLDFRRGQMTAAQERLQDLSRQEAQLRERQSQTERIKENAAKGGLLPSADAQTLEQQRLQALRESLAQARALMAPGNPRLTLLETQVAAQEKIVSDQLAAAGAVSSDGSSATVFDLQLSDIAGQLSFIDAQRVQVEDQMKQLQASIDATPANAAKLDTMERDYNNTRAQYDAAVAKRARAETGEVVEALSRGQRISVIEQAVVPTDPDSPNRPLVAIVGVVVGAVFGAALVLLIELLHSGIRRPSELTTTLGITPLIILPYVRTQEQTARRRMILLVSLALTGATVLAILVFIHTQYMPLDLFLERLAQRLHLA